MVTRHCEPSCRLNGLLALFVGEVGATAIASVSVSSTRSKSQMTKKMTGFFCAKSPLHCKGGRLVSATKILRTPAWHIQKFKYAAPHPE